jgi:A/G-specific adenine glycosylase
VAESSRFNSFFAQTLIHWYAQSKRELPWRETKDPYKIWISEIILQQTRVDQGLPYYLRFLKTFPDVKALAEAEEKTVLSVWQGLGYYSRARNLQKGAKQIVYDYKGKFPTSYNEWLTIKGVGSYTAAAVSSFCFLEKVPVLDGNVFRVLSRLFGMTEDIAQAKNKKVFWDKAMTLISADQPDIFNQAIMEFGALQCVPKSPDCERCVFKTACFAYQKNMVSSLPVKIKKLARRSRFFQYQVFYYNKQVLMRRRPSGDIWEGLLEFPLIEKIKQEALVRKPKTLSTALFIFQSEVSKHVLSHQDLYSRFYVFEVKTKSDWNTLIKTHEAEAISWKDLEETPKPVLLTKFLNAYFYPYFSIHK